MNRTVSRTCFAVAMLFSAASCTARAAAPNEKFFCDTTYGTTDNAAVIIHPQTNVLTGEMVFEDVHHGRFWAPVATVAFTDSSLPAGDCRCNGIKVRAFADYPDILGVYLVVDGEAQELGSVPSDKPVTFKLTFDEKDRITLQVGEGIQTAVPRHTIRDLVKMSCASADVSFRNIKATIDETTLPIVTSLPQSR